VVHSHINIQSRYFYIIATTGICKRCDNSLKWLAINGTWVQFLPGTGIFLFTITSRLALWQILP